jgi:hypothetical protein
VNLYQLYAPTRGYDVYKEALVLAPDEETARTLHPNGKDRWQGCRWEDPSNPLYPNGSIHWSHCAMRAWENPSEVTVTLLGVAMPELGQEPRVLLASFFSG